MSLPNEVEWHYKFDEKLTEEQQKALQCFKKPKTGSMAYKLGVLGKDIGYSLSPKIHLAFVKQHNYPIEYLIYDIDKDPITSL